MSRNRTQMQHTSNRGALSKRSHFIKKQFQFMRYSVQVIQEVIPQDDNPQRICPRTWKTQADDNRQGAGRGLIKQKRRQFTKRGARLVGNGQGQSRGIRPRNNAGKSGMSTTQSGRGRECQAGVSTAGVQTGVVIMLTGREKIEIDWEGADKVNTWQTCNLPPGGS